MDMLNFREKIKKNLFEYEKIDLSDFFILFLILIIPTLILLIFDLTNIIPLVLLTEILVYFLVNHKLPRELLIKFIFLSIIVFSFCIFSAAFSSSNPIILLIFAIAWFGIYTLSMFFGRFTRIFGLLGLLYFLIVSLNLTTLNINTFQIWLLSILSTIFSGFVVVIINNLKNRDAICILVSNCFNLDSSLSEICYTEELASEFSNRKLISLIGIAKDIKIAKLNIDNVKSDLDLDVLVTFENILQEADKLTYIIKYNLSKNNPNFTISLKKFKNKLKLLYKFKNQDVDIKKVLAKSEELFTIFQRTENILKTEFDEEYIVPNLTSDIYVADIIKANLNMDNIYVQNFIRFTVANILSILILVLTNNYNIYNAVFTILLISLIIKANADDSSLIYSHMITILISICLSLGVSVFCSSNMILILTMFLIFLIPSFKNNILIKDFIFIMVVLLIKINDFNMVISLNYIFIWLIVSSISLFVNLIIYPRIHKTNLKNVLSFKLKANFDFVFEVLLSQNLNKYSDYWNQVSNKNYTFESALNTIINDYDVDNEFILSYSDVSASINSITCKSLAFNTHVNHQQVEELTLSLNLIKTFMDEIIYNLDNNSKIANYFQFEKIYSEINKFKKNEDKKSILAIDYLLWIVYDTYVLSIFLDNLFLINKFGDVEVIY